MTFKTLNYLKDNDVVVVGLPALTSHVLQTLHVGVFGPLKEELKNCYHVGQYTHLIRLETTFIQFSSYSLQTIKNAGPLKTQLADLKEAVSGTLK